MTEELYARRVEVSFVGASPAHQEERASAVSAVEIDGSILRCLACGSFRPFLEALRGHECRQPHVDFNALFTLEPGAPVKPFRFWGMVIDTADARALSERARKAEALGFDGLSSTTTLTQNP